MHAAHVRSALDIVRDNTIRCAPVTDESHLVNTPIRVVFVSPFEWFTGSRYGCIQFRFEWEQLFAGKNIYWAEVVMYRYPACRFLISENRYPEYDFLRLYDPTRGDGPWWYDSNNNQHYQNKKVCLEFMIEEDLRLRDSLETRFVPHSDDFCCLHRNAPKKCAEFNKPVETVGAWFIGQLLGNHLEASRVQLTEDKGETVAPSQSLTAAWKHISSRLWNIKNGYTKHLRPGDPAAPAVARSILAAIGYDNKEERKALASLFHSREEAIAACSTLIQQSFHLSVPLSTGDEA